jgi:glutamine amidotransferase
MKIVLFDYGAGNLHSLHKALERPGVTVDVARDPREALLGDALVLPGVGAFQAATAALGDHAAAMRAAILGGLPTLGICLGMQLLFDASDEGGDAGLGVIPGRVRRLTAARVPQIGWNPLVDADDPLLAASGLATPYYANSYVAAPADGRAVVAWSDHDGDRFPAMVRAGACVGTQFHPEKSSTAGVSFVHAWVREVRERTEARDARATAAVVDAIAAHRNTETTTEGR